MLSFFDSWKPFDVNKVKPYLKMAVQRIQIATNKKTAAVKYVVGWPRGKLAGNKRKRKGPSPYAHAPPSFSLHTTL